MQVGILTCDLNIGEFPQVRVDDSSRALSDEKLASNAENKRQKVSHCAVNAAAQLGKIANTIQFMRGTKSLHWATLASGRVRCADRGTQLHQRLVQMGAITPARF